MRRPAPGLAARLVAVVLIIAAVAAVAGGFFLRRASEAAFRDEVVQRQVQLAERLAVVIDDRIRTFRAMLAAAATRRVIERLDPGEARIELGVLLRGIPEFESFVLYDGDGRPLAARAGARVASLGDVPVLADPGSVEGKPDMAKLIVRDGRAVVDIVVPVESPPGTRVGSLGGSVSIDDVAGRIETLSFAESDVAFFVDGGGTILAHRERDRVVRRERFPLERVGDGSAVLEGPAGEGSLVSAARTSTIDGAVVIQQPERDALQPVGQAVTRLTLVLAFVVAGIVFGVMLAARSFLKPLGPLVGAVQRFGRGQSHARAPVIRGRELGLVARQFNATADALEERVAALRASEERFWRAFEHAPSGMVISSADGDFVQVNRAFCAMVDREERDLIGSQISTITHPDDRERDREAFEQMVMGERDSYMVEKRYLRPDGSVAYALVAVAPLPALEGQPIMFFGQQRDISDRKEMEASLEASSKMYAAAYEREREAAARLRALDEMKNTFLAAVSHELRTPLTSIVGFSETLLARGADLPREQADEFVARIVANANKLERLLSDLLDLDRLARGIIEPNRREVDLGALVQRIAESSDAIAGREVHLDVEPAVLSADAGMVERMLENLLANAAKHTPPATPVWVRVRPRDGGAELIVEDAGPGIPPEVRERIFRPFDRGGPPRADSPGTGIGLALVARFAELHHGHAWVGERHGGGASFHVFLPDRDAVRPHSRAS